MKGKSEWTFPLIHLEIHKSLVEEAESLEFPVSLYSEAKNGRNFVRSLSVLLFRVNSRSEALVALLLPETQEEGRGGPKRRTTEDDVVSRKKELGTVCSLRNTALVLEW